MKQVLQTANSIHSVGTFNDFFTKQKEYITIAELSKNITISNIDELDQNSKIFTVSTLKKADDKSVSFLSNAKYVKDLKETKAGFCLIDRNHKDIVPKNTTPIVVDNPHFAYTVILNILYFVPIFEVNAGISDRANVDSSAKIGKNTEIQAGAFIDKNVVIGNNCKICANVVINHGCIIGDNTYIGANATISYSKIGHDTIIHNGANIGQCGFGFVHEKGFNYKIPQLGIVEIGDFVEIGAGTCVDRGAFDNTKIGNNTKIDNLNQIAHGVEVGNGCFFASHVGISGSTKIGNFVQLGGQTGIAGHIRIGDGVQAAGKTGILSDVEAMSVIGGVPSMPIKDWHRTTINLKKMLKKEGK
ncbi:MAG: UDP-3-O-(3-hydroxymyristoyl)glucosamine N-acyltransferase [Rickettsiales bacterium]|nr:UDP-3-O-(3-hydroxymyristoyl)glucosamine N-acyltransferase [Rickettsiales bacterium]